jgi:Transcription initiation factor IIA, gamma subunit, helical domain
MSDSFFTYTFSEVPKRLGTLLTPSLLFLSRRIGMALTDSLDELITSGAITPQLAMKVLQQVHTF